MLLLPDWEWLFSSPILLDCTAMPRLRLSTWTRSRFSFAVVCSGSSSQATSELRPSLSLADARSRAIADEPMLINHFQGVCSYPDAIDDDLITSQGMFTQPAHRTSLLAGFVSVSRLFRILSECFFFLRCIEAQIEPAVNVDLEWARKAELRVHEVLNTMPDGGGDQREVFAMQKANVVVTAAIVKFAIVSLSLRLL